MLYTYETRFLDGDIPSLLSVLTQIHKITNRLHHYSQAEGSEESCEDNSPLIDRFAAPIWADEVTSYISWVNALENIIFKMLWETLLEEA